MSEDNVLAISVPTYTAYRVVRRPETPEDALALAQALYDVGVSFNANSDDKRALFDANPMLERES